MVCAGLTVVHRKFDFTRLAESALLDDFEIVADGGGSQHADASDTSSLTSSSSSHGAVAAAAAAAAADRVSHVPATYTQRLGVAALQPVAKHVCVFSLTASIKLEFHDADTDTDADILARILTHTSDARFPEVIPIARRHSRDDPRRVSARESVSVSV